MGRLFDKDQLIEEMQEKCRDLEEALDDIEAYGERFQCPSENCKSTTCTKPCFARSCFDWCLTHSHPSAEVLDGVVSIEVQRVTRDADGQLVSRTEVEDRRVCGHEEAEQYPADCKIVTSPFVGDFDDDTGVFSTAENQLWQFEEERRLMEARDSP